MFMRVLIFIHLFSLCPFNRNSIGAAKKIESGVTLSLKAAQAEGHRVAAITSMPESPKKD